MDYTTYPANGRNKGGEKDGKEGEREKKGRKEELHVENEVLCNTNS